MQDKREAWDRSRHDLFKDTVRIFTSKNLEKYHEKFIKILCASDDILLRELLNTSIADASPLFFVYKTFVQTL
jgi:hypothetical protein